MERWSETKDKYNDKLEVQYENQKSGSSEIVTTTLSDDQLKADDGMIEYSGSSKYKYISTKEITISSSTGTLSKIYFYMLNLSEQ